MVQGEGLLGTSGNAGGERTAKQCLSQFRGSRMSEHGLLPCLRLLQEEEGEGETAGEQLEHLVHEFEHYVKDEPQEVSSA